MLRATILFLGLVAACVAAPQSASAQSPRDLFGIVTRPLDAILGTVRRIGRPPPRFRRPATPLSRRAARPPAPIRDRTASQGAAAGAAAAAVAATGSNASVPLPTAAPGQRNAALSIRSNDARRRGNESPRIDAQWPVRGPSELGLVGPLAWPTAYEDIIGFSLWPSRYDQQLRAHGIGDVLITIFAPAGMTASTSRVEVARAKSAAPGRADVDNVRSTGPCIVTETSAPNWPSRQIGLAIKVTRAQRIAIDKLQAAVNEAISSIRATCRDEALLTPVDRMRSLQNRLWAVRDAALLIRAPLSNFYNSLTDEEKKQFIVETPKQDAQTQGAQAENAKAQSAQAQSAQAQAGAMSAQSQQAFARMCGAPGINQWPVREIEQVLKPTKSQHDSLAELQKKSSEMGQLLMASCMVPTASTPMERLDTASEKLTAVIFAASNVSLALNDFYGQLSDEQKSRFDSLSN